MKYQPPRGSSRRAAIAAALLALVFSAAAPAAAGMGKGDGEIGFDFGVTDLDIDYAYRNDGAAGLTFRGGYFLTDMLEIEGQLGAYASTNLVWSDVTLRTLMVDVVFNFRPDTSVMPYALVGAGVANVDYDQWFDLLPGPGIDDSSAALQVGGGSRFFFGKAKKVAVRVDLAFLIEETFDNSSTHARFTAGFTWRLGR
jgi:opacity protein-like surface antigen